MTNEEIIEELAKAAQNCSRDKPFSWEGCAMAVVTRLAEIGPSPEMIDADIHDGFGPTNVSGPYRPHANSNEFYLNMPQLERIFKAMLSSLPLSGERG